MHLSEDGGKAESHDSADGTQRLVPSPTDGVQHPVNPDVIADTNVRHILRGNKDILLVGIGIRRVDLRRQGNVSFGGNREGELGITIIFILMRRLTASMKTSNSSRKEWR